MPRLLVPDDDIAVVYLGNFGEDDCFMTFCDVCAPTRFDKNLPWQLRGHVDQESWRCFIDKANAIVARLPPPAMQLMPAFLGAAAAAAILLLQLLWAEIWGGSAFLLGAGLSGFWLRKTWRKSFVDSGLADLVDATAASESFNGVSLRYVAVPRLAISSKISGGVRAFVVELRTPPPAEDEDACEQQQPQ
eukprot:gnl/TRDRNA2_/TRDRNA2_43743_c0_seq1.p1 gnl/TRDRNA2_/TRDRNA2_43743_c0~~gnl/TRDRNA2_/TRDRNA2_43743_c0_seq1.p1  ORF type:complete len:190 (+),score=43.01 gnl/TRDRNA2_/TRDRNA2_43743_c0_seq1:70-639(+)